MRTWPGVTAAVLGLCAATPALAAGGAHFVDDAGVETPGTCHVESWATGYGHGRGLANLSLACTGETLPRAEIGGSVQYLPDHPDDATVGPALKLNLVPNSDRLGVALTAAAAWSLRRDRLETASVVAPLSWNVSERTQVNFNTGWTYARGGDHRHDMVFGAQANYLARENVSLMAEVFGHARLRGGGQVGVRWNPRGDVDVDLLAGRYIDGTSRTAVTLGVTVRH